MTVEWADCPGDQATCPECGESWGDLWEYELEDGGVVEIECLADCGAKLLLTVSISVDYRLARRGEEGAGA